MVISVGTGLFVRERRCRFEVYWFLDHGGSVLLHASAPARRPPSRSTSPPLRIQPKYETIDVKTPSKRGPRVKVRRSSEPNFIFDGVLTFIAINSSHERRDGRQLE